MKIVLSLEKFNVVNGFDITKFPKEFTIYEEEEMASKNFKMQDKCLLIFQVFNSSEDFFELSPILGDKELKTTKKCMISPFSSQRVCIPMDRFYIPYSEIEPPKKDNSVQYVKTNEVRSEEEIYLQNLEHCYKTKLLSLLQLKWISSRNDLGFISLSQLSLTYDKLLSMMPSQLLVEYQLDEKEKVGEQHNYYKVSLLRVLPITLCVKNNKPCPIYDCKILLQPSSKKDSNVSSATEGQDFIYYNKLYDTIPKLEENETALITFHVMLLQKKEYVFLAKAECSTLDMSHSKIDPLYLFAN